MAQHHLPCSMCHHLQCSSSRAGGRVAPVQGQGGFWLSSAPCHCCLTCCGLTAVRTVSLSFRSGSRTGPVTPGSVPLVTRGSLGRQGGAVAPRCRPPGADYRGGGRDQDRPNWHPHLLASLHVRAVPARRLPACHGLSETCASEVCVFPEFKKPCHLKVLPRPLLTWWRGCCVLAVAPGHRLG